MMAVPDANHRGLDCGYNVAMATKCADFSWPEVTKLMSKNRKLDRPFMQRKILVEMI